jgi:hypothetical protein
MGGGEEFCLVRVFTVKEMNTNRFEGGHTAKIGHQ